jgi:hypothetical protein
MDINHEHSTSTRADRRRDVGAHSAEEKIRKLEQDNGLLRGRIRGFVTLSDMYKESKQRNQLVEKQNSLLIQILSFLTNVKATDGDEASVFPEELQSIMTLEERPAEESLKILSSITAKLKSNTEGAPFASQSNTKDNTKPKSEDTTLHKKEVQQLAQESKKVHDDPPPYPLLHETEPKDETESQHGQLSSSSFSIIERRSETSQQYRDEFADLKEKVRSQDIVASEKVKSVCDLLELVLRGGHRTDEDLSQCLKDITRAVLQLELEKSLKTDTSNADEKNTRPSDKDSSNAMGLVQSPMNDASWVDVEPDLPHHQEIDRLRKENDRKEDVIAKLRGHVDELTKANIAWEEQYETMKKEYTTKLLKLKSSSKVTAKNHEHADVEEFILVGPDDDLPKHDKEKVHKLEQEIEVKNATIEKLYSENKKLVASSRKDLSHSQKDQETEMNLLRQQIRLFKDDFATERNEHKKLWKKHQKLSEEYKEMKKKMQEASSRLARTQKQLATEKREKELLQMSLLKSHCVHPCHHDEPTNRVSRTPSPTPPPDNGKWSCPLCTYENVPERWTCEMCGKTGPNHPSVQNAPLISRGIKKKKENVILT